MDEEFKKSNRIYNCSNPVVKNDMIDFVLGSVEFNDFFDFNLFDDLVRLEIEEKRKAIPSKNYVPAYVFSIYHLDEKVGFIEIRIGYTKGLYYGGNIGYSILEGFMNKGYATRACELIKHVAAKHKMEYIYITNSTLNIASIRVCQKLNAKFIRTVVLPEDSEMRRIDNLENVNIWKLETNN